MNVDRRVQRTRELLENALIELLRTREYDAITIRDISDAANVGRTTFYLHYESKEELYRHAHWAEVARIGGDPLTRSELLGDDPPTRMLAVYAYHWATRDLLRAVYFGQDAEIIQRRLRDHSAEHLRMIFAGVPSNVPIDVVATSLAVMETGLMMWWIEKHSALTPEQMATYYHRLRRGVLREGLAID